MTVRQAWREAAAELRRAGVPDPEYDSAQLLAHVTGMNHLALRLCETEMTSEQVSAFRDLISRRREREPLQYLLGTVFFRGLEFLIGPGALIPRPETELLSAWAEEEIRENPGPEILDLCCGSGCLGLSLAARLPGARVSLTDLSPQALVWARRNRERLGVKAEILEGDLFAPVAGRQFDCVVANPPYIPSAECGGLQPEVLREPRMALDGGGDGLDFCLRIAGTCGRHLLPGGVLLLEVGEGEAEAAARLLAEGGAEQTEIRPDEAGIPRMVMGRYGKRPGDSPAQA